MLIIPLSVLLRLRKRLWQFNLPLGFLWFLHLLGLGRTRPTISPGFDVPLDFAAFQVLGLPLQEGFGGVGLVARVRCFDLFLRRFFVGQLWFFFWLIGLFGLGRGLWALGSFLYLPGLCAWC